jgi:hypothetical protein
MVWYILLRPLRPVIDDRLSLSWSNFRKHYQNQHNWRPLDERYIQALLVLVLLCGLLSSTCLPHNIVIQQPDDQSQLCSNNDDAFGMIPIHVNWGRTQYSTDILKGFSHTHKARVDLSSIADIGRIYIKGYLYPISYPKIARADLSSIADIERIYIKGYLYPISYPKIAKKDMPLILFLSGICWRI